MRAMIETRYRGYELHAANREKWTLCSVLFLRLFEGTLALGERPKGLISGNGCNDIHQVPLAR